ncbi:MAG: tetratricopeptide (TPR) repeat protein, partial [Phenylobacterium sp.]
MNYIKHHHKVHTANHWHQTIKLYNIGKTELIKTPMPLMPITIPESLQQALQNHTVVPFVGAGLSMSVLAKETGESLFPSWSQLLKEAAEKLVSENKPQAAQAIDACLGYIEEDSYLRAAKIAQKELGKQQWNDFLKSQLDPPKSNCVPASLTSAEKVWQLGSQLIITTNYDKVLNWSCPAALRDELTLWPIEATHELQQALSKPVERPTLWHLHGHIDNVNKIILTPDGYQALYGDEVKESEYKAALMALRTFLATRTLLFIGFSFADETFYRQLKIINDIFDGNSPTHYVLIKADQQQAIDGLGLPLQTITYQQHSDLPQVLAKLAECVTDSTTSPAIPAVESPTTPGLKFNQDNHVFHLPFKPKGDGVVGREDALQQLRHQLTEGRPTSIGQAAAFKGIGGLGKTQLAIEYAYRYKDDYPKGVIWITADQEISPQLIQIAKAGQWISPQSEHKVILDAAIKRITSYSDCLVIFDNVDELNQIQPYLPTVSANPHLLITSRVAIRGFTAIELALLTPAQGLELLFKEAVRDPSTTSAEQITAAEIICGELSYLPLAIEIAGAYLKSRTIIQFSHYQQMLADNLEKATNSQDIDSFTGHQQDLFLTLQITESEISRSPQLKPVLQLLSWSASSSMGLSLMTALLQITELELLDALSLGVELRLLTASEDGQRYSIHRLLQQVQRQLSPVSEHTQLGQQICDRMIDWFKPLRDDFNDLITFEAEQDHLVTWAELAKQYSWLQNAGLIWLQAVPYYFLGKYQQCDDLLQQAISWLDVHQTTEKTILRADILNDRDRILSMLGKPKQALGFGQKALALKLELLGEKYPDVATSYDNIGGCFSDLGQHKEALEFKQKALVLRRDLLGEKHLDIAISLDNIGISYSYLGQHEKALSFKQKALALRLELRGEKHPVVAISYNNVGTSYGYLDQNKQALAFKQKAFTLWLELLGPEHPDTITALENTIITLLKLKQFPKANDTLYQFKKALPDKHQLKQKMDELQSDINRES